MPAKNLTREKHSTISKFMAVVRENGTMEGVRRAGAYLLRQSRIRLIGPPIIYLGKKKVHDQFTDDPIIVGGCARSGTTLLLSILGAHPKIYSFPEEMRAFTRWHRHAIGKGYSPRIDCLYYHILTQRIPEEVTRWCEKTPRNVRYFSRILDYFGPSVKLIHIVRDGRDVMLSRHPTDPNTYWVSPDRWVNDVRAGLRFAEHPQVLTIKYEDLVSAYHNTLMEICGFIGDKYVEQLNDWVSESNVTGSKVQKDAWFELTEDIHTESIGKWKQTQDMERVHSIMKEREVIELLRELDYM